MKNGHIVHFLGGIHSREDVILNMEKIYKDVYHKGIYDNKELQAF